MAKIKHIAIATQDPDKTAKFYIDVLGLKEIAKINSRGATGYHLSDGDINFAILKFKNDQVAGIENGKEVSGLHHIGFEVESLDETAKHMAAFNVQQRDDINGSITSRQCRSQVWWARWGHHRPVRDRVGRHLSSPPLTPIPLW